MHVGLCSPSNRHIKCIVYSSSSCYPRQVPKNTDSRLLIISSSSSSSSSCSSTCEGLKTRKPSWYPQLATTHQSHRGNKMVHSRQTWCVERTYIRSRRFIGHVSLKTGINTSSICLRVWVESRLKSRKSKQIRPSMYLLRGWVHSSSALLRCGVASCCCVHSETPLLSSVITKIIIIIIVEGRKPRRKQPTTGNYNTHIIIRLQYRRFTGTPTTFVPHQRTCSVALPKISKFPFIYLFSGL